MPSKGQPEYSTSGVSMGNTACIAVVILEFSIMAAFVLALAGCASTRDPNVTSPVQHHDPATRISPVDSMRPFFAFPKFF